MRARLSPSPFHAAPPGREGFLTPPPPRPRPRTSGVTWEPRAPPTPLLSCRSTPLAPCSWPAGVFWEDPCVTVSWLSRPRGPRVWRPWATQTPSCPPRSRGRPPAKSVSPSYSGLLRWGCHRGDHRTGSGGPCGRREHGGVGGTHSWGWTWGPPAHPRPPALAFVERSPSGPTQWRGLWAGRDSPQGTHRASGYDWSSPQVFLARGAGSGGVGAGSGGVGSSVGEAQAG